MTEPKEQFGYVIVAAGYCYLAIVSGDNRKEVGHINYDIPKKQRNGGYSANRFQRIRTEVRHTFLTIVGEECRRKFLSPDQNPVVTGLIIAGAAEMKEELKKGDFLGPVLSKIVLGVYDVNYGGKQGLNEAIKLSSEFLRNISIVREEKELTELFDKIGKNQPVAIGLQEVVEALEMKAVHKLLIYKDSECKHPSSSIPMVDWILQNYKEYGFTPIFISNQTPTGSQFINGFGGIAADLRFQVLFSHDIELYGKEESNDGFDSDFDDEENIM